MINIIITAFREPQIAETINSILKQKIESPYKLIVSTPDKETQKIVKQYSKNKNVKYFQDPGKGKSYALNLLFKKLKGDILIFTDGDVFVSENSINEILKEFKDPKVGCVTGRPISTNSKNNVLGYWSHLLFDAGAHRIRKELNKQGKFLECSGYLFAFRNGLIKKIPMDVAEDSIIPYYFWKQGYKIAYAENAKVYVSNPTNFKDWLKQRKRTAKAHESLNKYAKDFPRIKSFSNEVLRGSFSALSYPENPKELFWTFLLFPARFYMWLSVFWETRFTKKHYHDAWERVESTRTLDK